MSLPFLNRAQSKAVNRFFDKYKNEETAIRISVPKWMLNTSSNLVQYTPAKDLMRKAKKVRLLLLDDPETIKYKHIRKLERRMRKENFEDIITLRNDKLNIQLLGKLCNDHSDQLVFKAFGKDAAFLISMEGNFKQSDLDQITNKINQFSNLKDL